LCDKTALSACPEAGLKLFCDEMLGRLGRWLRAAGYDTAIAEGRMADAEIVARCIAEARILITRDRHLEARAHGPVRVIRLTANRVEEQARALPGIDWQYAPFTRCLVDNAPLSPAPPEMADQVPSDSRAAGGPLQVCPECGRLYWPGGHVRRMADMLRRLASA
jgi:uncharacterized protein with PIN domain